MDAALAPLGPGSDIDLSGTTITPDLLGRLLVALTPNEKNARPILGTALFTETRFSGGAWFNGVRFSADAHFDGALFNGLPSFLGAQFSEVAAFTGAHFSEGAGFANAQFSAGAVFDRARFSGGAWFNGARFSREARFNDAQFSEVAVFTELHFSGGAGFANAQFSAGAVFDRAWFRRDAVFAGAQFSAGAVFSGARFSGDAVFNDTHFSGEARLNGAQFSREARFNDAQFSEVAVFTGAHFGGAASFANAQFSADAVFTGAQFSRDAVFKDAQFNRDAVFNDAQFNRDAGFDGARFEGLWSGPLVCRGVFSAVGIAVARAVRLQVAAVTVRLRSARFAAPAVFSVRYGAVDLTDVAADAPLTVAFHHAPFKTSSGAQVDESSVAGQARAKVDSLAKVTSLAGVDAANVVLVDVDLSRCVFSGTHHLDQIRLEGRCLFAAAPRGWQRAGLRVRRWTRRKVLAEEAAWRADPLQPSLTRAGWSNPGDPDDPVPAPSPAQLAVLYRQLRKALEDGKDTPGAADFYYGEMEARRHDHQGTPRAERALLHAYWLLSGYALRASRALGFLAATATATFLLMMTIGLPDNQLNPQITGTVLPNGGRVTLTQSTPDPALTLPLSRRFTPDRADKAGLVVVNSVIFRSTGATLTGPGTWIEIISRIGEPVLLGFAAVAARGRIQR